MNPLFFLVLTWDHMHGFLSSDVGSTNAASAFDLLKTVIDHTTPTSVIFVTDGGFDSPSITYSRRDIIPYVNINSFLMLFPPWCPDNAETTHRSSLVGILPPATSIRAERALDLSIAQRMITDCVGDVGAMATGNMLYTVLGGKFLVAAKFVQTVKSCMMIVDSAGEMASQHDDEIQEFQKFLQLLLELYDQILESCKVNLLNSLRSPELKTLWYAHTHVTRGCDDVLMC